MTSTVAFSFFAILLAGGLVTARSATDNKSPRYVAKFDAKFKAADRDGDNALTREEAGQAGMGRIVGRFDSIDSDKNGKVTRKELHTFLVNRLSS